MGRHQDAEPLYVEALAVMEARLGAEHPTTRRVAANLAGLRDIDEAGTAGTVSGASRVLLPGRVERCLWAPGSGHRGRP